MKGEPSEFGQTHKSVSYPREGDRENAKTTDGSGISDRIGEEEVAVGQQQK